MSKHINIKVSGKVQGVGFRWSAYEKFVELGLTGRAENTADGNVLIDIEGPEEKLDILVEWCGHGPMGAKVENVEVAEISTPFAQPKNS